MMVQFKLFFSAFCTLTSLTSLSASENVYFDFCAKRPVGNYAHDSDCSKYISCVHGSAYVRDCPASMRFDEAVGRCDVEGRVACGPNALPPPSPQPLRRRHGKGERGASAATRGRGSNFDMVHNDLPDIMMIRRMRHPKNAEFDEGFVNEDGIELRQYPVEHELPRQYPRINVPYDSPFVQEIREYLTEGLDYARKALEDVYTQQSSIAQSMPNNGGIYRMVQSFAGSSPLIRQMSMPALQQLKCLLEARDRFNLDGRLLVDITESIGSILKPNDYAVRPDADYPPPAMGECPFPRNDEMHECDSLSKYQSFDGTCNNIRRPLWGRAMRPFNRFLPPDYADDLNEPRRARSGRPLPSSRSISLALFDDRERFSKVHNLMFLTFGQFLDHDLTRVAGTKMSKDVEGRGEMIDIQCGEDGCETEGYENEACHPIEVPPYDPDFQGKRCLTFVRSEITLLDNCRLGPREQLNQLSSHIDSNMIYGNSRQEADNLRDFSDPGRGRLKVTPHPFNPHLRPLLPMKQDKDCVDLNSTIQCFNAGDSRVNQQVGLMSIHTVWHRWHNEIEEELYRINPHWSGDRLFFEARRIVNAGWQHVIFKEYLPVLLGPDHMKKYTLELEDEGFFRGYDDTINPEIANVFAAAAFRYGHSSIDQYTWFVDHNWDRHEFMYLTSVFHRPHQMYNTNLPGRSGVDAIILGQIYQPQQNIDRHFSKQVTAHLFTEHPPHGPGMDLTSLNIQRGRDHGIPGYNEWRRWCDLPVATSFDDMPDVPHVVGMKLGELYESIEDVDLFPAGVSEVHVSGGVVGPTFACIISRQFFNLRSGDRFWYENYDPEVGFTEEQMKEVQKVLFSRIICDTLDYVATIQKFVLLQPLDEAFKNFGMSSLGEAYSLASLYKGEKNERQPCAEIERLDLTKWREGN